MTRLNEEKLSSQKLLSDVQSELNLKEKEIVENHKTYEEKYSQLSNKNKVLEETLQKEIEVLRGKLGETESKLQLKETALQVCNLWLQYIL